MTEAITHPPVDDSPWLLDSLFPGPDRRYWPLASFVLGLLGVATFAIAASAAAGVFIASVDHGKTESSDLVVASAALLALLPLAGAYVAVLLSLHLIGSCRLPITVRLSMIYGTLYVSLGALLGGLEVPVTSWHVLYATPFCLGSFLQRRLGRWTAVSWNTDRCQPTIGPPSRITIGTLLDVTAAIALTLWLVPLSDPSVSTGAYVCFLPTAGVSALLGMHVWARLTAICNDSSDVVSGFGLWMAGNVSLACLLWLVLAIVVLAPQAGFIGFVNTILVVVVAHWWTEIPIRWLKACGWRLIRAERSALNITPTAR